MLLCATSCSTCAPSQRDHLEDKPVYECLLKLLQSRNSQLLALLPQLLVLFAKVIPDQSGVEGSIRSSLASALVALRAELPDALSAALAVLPQDDHKAVLQHILSP